MVVFVIKGLVNFLIKIAAIKTKIEPEMSFCGFCFSIRKFAYKGSWIPSFPECLSNIGTYRARTSSHLIGQGILLFFRTI